MRAGLLTGSLQGKAYMIQRYYTTLDGTQIDDDHIEGAIQRNRSLRLQGELNDAGAWAGRMFLVVEEGWKLTASAVLATVLWPLILLGINLHIH